jgi:hypothetical protein
LEERAGFTLNGLHAAEDRTLRHELRGGTAYGVPFGRFLHATFGVDEWRSALKLGDRAASSGPVKSLARAYLQKKNAKEDSLYQPLVDILNYALEHYSLPFRCIVRSASVLEGAAIKRKYVLSRSIRLL